LIKMIIVLMVNHIKLYKY